MADYIVMPKLGFDMREGVLNNWLKQIGDTVNRCLLYTSPSPRDRTRSRMPSSA